MPSQNSEAGGIVVPPVAKCFVDPETGGSTVPESEGIAVPDEADSAVPAANVRLR